MSPDLQSFAAQKKPSLIVRLRQFISGLYWRSFVAGLLIPLLIGGAYGYMTRASAQTQTQSSLTTVRTQTIVSSVKATGKVTFASEQTLKFNQRGTVTKVNFKEGDHVKEGQIIAEIDKSSVVADIRQAQLAVNASALQLQQLQNDKNSTINDAQNALKVSQEKLPSDLAAAQRSVTEKQSALQQAQLDLEKTKSTELQAQAQTAQDSVTSSEKLLDSIYSVLTREQESRPPLGNYDLTIDHFLYNDPVAQHAVEDSYTNALNADMAMHDRYGSTLGAQRDPAILQQALTDADAFAKNVADLAEKTYDMLQGATTDTTNFTADKLNTYRATINGDRTTASDLVGTLDTALANLVAVSSNSGVPSVTLKAKEDAVTTAANDLKLAQENLAVLQTQTPGDLQSKQESLNTAVTSTDINIQLKQNDLAQKAAAVQKASQSLTDYELIAPFDGVLTHIDYKVRDNLLDTGDTEYAILQNPDYIVVTIPLDQVDVVRVHTGMPAQIVFDALPGQTFDGTIDLIDPTAIVQSGVVSYNVEIKLPRPQNLTILSGMTTTVTIETARKENVLAVPNLALRQGPTGATVQLQSGQSVPVQTGVSDGQYTEIVSGLQAGQRVAAMNVAATAGSTSVSANQLFRLGGGGGGGGFGGGGGGGGRGGGGG